MYSIKDISERTGLKITFIRRCLTILQDLFKPHIKRGNFNQILIDPNGLVIFDKIKQMKEQKLSLPEIKIHFEQISKGTETREANEMQTPMQPVMQGDQALYYVEKILETQQTLNEEKDKHLQEVREKEETIRELIRKNEALTGTLKMLPEGKSPEEIRKEYTQQQLTKQEAARIIGELKTTTGILKGKRRKELVKQLENLLF